jgi:hypothetical protein
MLHPLDLVVAVWNMARASDRNQASLALPKPKFRPGQSLCHWGASLFQEGVEAHTSWKGENGQIPAQASGAFVLACFGL